MLHQDNNNNVFDKIENNYSKEQSSPDPVKEIPYTENDLEKFRQRAKELYLRELVNISEEEAQELADEEVESLKEEMNEMSVVA